MKKFWDFFFVASIILLMCAFRYIDSFRASNAQLSICMLRESHEQYRQGWLSERIKIEEKLKKRGFTWYGDLAKLDEKYLKLSVEDYAREKCVDGRLPMVLYSEVKRLKTTNVR